MGCYILVIICIFVINKAPISQAQRIIAEERVPSSCSSEADQELFKSRVQEVFRELYLTQYMVFERKIIKMLEKQEQHLQNLKEQFADNQGNLQQQLSDLISRVSYLEKNQAEQNSNISDAQISNYKNLEMKIQQVEKRNQNISTLVQNTESIQKNILSRQGTNNIRISDLEENLNRIFRKLGNLNSTLNTYDKDMRDVLIRQSDVQTTILMIQNNITLLNTKSSLFQDAFNDHNDTLKKLEGGQNEIRSSVLVIRNNLGRLEAKSLSFDKDISEQNKTIERIWNSYNEIRNRIQSVVTESNTQNSAIELSRSNINRLSGSLSATKAKMLTMERMIGPNARLVNGSTLSEGRVEVFYNGEWGTVCDDIWTYDNARVICRHLGYFSGVPFDSATFGKGKGKIWMDNVVCKGSESNIFNCAYPSIGTHNCGHHEDAGVVCLKSFAVRLMKGTSLSRDEGRVEILINGTWGTICDDNWDTNDAKVVCRYLGYTGAAVAHARAYYGQGDGELPIYLDNVACTGSETFIFDCQHNGVGTHNCNHGEDAGVKCSRAYSTGFVPIPAKEETQRQTNDLV